MTTKLGPGTVTFTYADGSKESFEVDSFTVDPQKPTPVGFQVFLPEVSAAAWVTWAAGQHWVRSESTPMPSRDGMSQLSKHLSAIAPRAWKPEKPEPLTPGPRARAKAQWKRERFTR